MTRVVSLCSRMISFHLKSHGDFAFWGFMGDGFQVRSQLETLWLNGHANLQSLSIATAGWCFGLQRNPTVILSALKVLTMFLASHLCYAQCLGHLNLILRPILNSVCGLLFSGLPLEYWNPRSISKIASRVGLPIEVDRRTIRAETVDGPRVLVLVDALAKPLESFPITMHDGTIFEQKVDYDFYPSMCSTCHRMGHSFDMCRLSAAHSNRGVPPNPPREDAHVIDQDNNGWQVQRDRRRRNSSNRRGRSLTKQRSRSRRPAHTREATPNRVHPLNTHVRFATPTTSEHVSSQTSPHNEARPLVPDMARHEPNSSSSESSSNAIAQFKIQYRNGDATSLGSVVAESPVPSSSNEVLKDSAMKEHTLPLADLVHDAQVVRPSRPISPNSDLLQVPIQHAKDAPPPATKGGQPKPSFISKSIPHSAQRKAPLHQPPSRSSTVVQKGAQRIHRKGYSNPPPLSRASALELLDRDAASPTMGD